MSDDEVMQAEASGPSEAQLAMQKRRAPTSTAGLDDDAQQMLEENKQERARMEEEINELRDRSEKRKRERQEEEKLMTQRRIEEDHRRKAEEEERRVKKLEDEMRKKEERMKKMAEFEKWKNPQSPNFVIQKKDRPIVQAEEEVDNEPKISKEQLEAEKRAILAQRVQPLSIDGADAAKLADRAKELHNQLYRLESEKYDLEKRFKAQQVDMMDLAERARQMNKVGNQGSIKRIQLSEEESDKIQERFAGTPARIVMYSEYERTKDKRPFDNRRGLYVGPVYGYPADRIKPQRILKWNDEGLPMYEEEVGTEEGQEVAE